VRATPRPTRIRFLTTRYEALQGLRSIPIGVCLTAFGVAQAIRPDAILSPPDGPAGLALIAMLTAGLLLLERRIAAWYASTYGWVQRRPTTPDWQLLGPLVLMAVVIVTLGVTATAHLPITLGLAAITVEGSALTLLNWRRYGGVRPSEALITVGFAVAALAAWLRPAPLSRWWLAHSGGPQWGWGWGLVGLACILGGLLDHLTVVRSFPRPLEESAKAGHDTDG
jgi:hypothetical protein